VGADAPTVNLLKTLGGGSIALSAAVTTPAIVSPADGASFTLPFSWQLGMDPSLIDTAESLGVGNITISGAKLPVGPEDGATGNDVVGQPPSRSLTLAQATSFSEGPFSGSFVRDGAIGDPIVFAIRPVNLTASVALGGAAINLNIACAPQGAASMTLVDQEGTPPPEVLGETEDRDLDCDDITGTTVVGDDDPNDLDNDGDGIGCEVSEGALPKTGGSPFGLALIGLGAIDFGYLALTASRPRRRT